MGRPCEARRGVAKEALARVNHKSGVTMLGVLKTGVILLGFAALFLGGLQPASAGCELIKATNSAHSKAAAAKAAYKNAIDSANEVKRRRGWGYVNLRPKKVTPDPFWKSVRPVVTDDMLVKPDIVTSQTHTQCWRGVVKPYVCTAGAMACGN